jgi:hypothetical protein
MVVLYGADVHKVGLHMTVGGQQTGVPLLRAVHAPLRVEHNLKGNIWASKIREHLANKCAKTLMGKNPRGFYLTSGRNNLKSCVQSLLSCFIPGSWGTTRLEQGLF